jgi:hypothetical protein
METGSRPPGTLKVTDHLALPPALIALFVAIKVMLIMTNVAELGLQCALVACQIGGVSCGRSLAATANVFIEPGPVTGDVRAHRIHPSLIAPEVPILVPPVLPLVIAAPRVVPIASRESPRSSHRQPSQQTEIYQNVSVPHFSLLMKAFRTFTEKNAVVAVCVIKIRGTRN